MMQIMASSQNLDDDDIEGFPYRWNSEYYYHQEGFIGAPSNSALLAPGGIAYEYGEIPPGSSFANSCQPMLGRFTQPKYILLIWGV